MTLAELRAEHPSLFYGQNWFYGEKFYYAEHEPGAISPLFTTTEVAGNTVKPIRAVDLAALYVAAPHRSVWKKFLWTDDVDAWGNRVYVSGVGQYGCDGFQIHRHLQPSAYWVRTT